MSLKIQPNNPPTFILLNRTPRDMAARSSETIFFAFQGTSASHTCKRCVCMVWREPGFFPQEMKYNCAVGLASNFWTHCLVSFFRRYKKYQSKWTPVLTQLCVGWGEGSRLVQAWWERAPESVAAHILGKEQQHKSCPELSTALPWQGSTEVVSAEVWDTAWGLLPLEGPCSAAPAETVRAVPAAASRCCAVTVCSALNLWSLVLAEVGRPHLTSCHA